MTFLRNCWYAAAWDDEVGRHLLARTILGEPVVLFRTESGRPVALEDRCCHKHLPLSMGVLKGDRVECGYHGMTYDANGTCVRIPAQASIPPTARVRAYPAAEKLGLVWIWPGDPGAAAESELFDLPAYDDPVWGLNRGPYTHVKADYRHMTDNLLDPAHAAFVHRSTLGIEAMEDVPVKTRVEEDTVIVTRWSENAPPIPLFAKVAEIEGSVDRWQVYRCYPPSISVTDFGSIPAGAGRADADLDKGVRMYSCHFITPETARSSHYFWMQLRNFRPDDTALSDAITEQFVLAFEEDKIILEAVQAAEDRGEGAPSVKLAIDNGPHRFRRIVERLIRAEDEETALAGSDRAAIR